MKSKRTITKNLKALETKLSELNTTFEKNELEGVEKDKLVTKIVSTSSFIEALKWILG